MQRFRSLTALKPLIAIVCVCLVALVAIIGTQAAHASNAQEQATPPVTTGSVPWCHSDATCTGKGPSGGIVPVGQQPRGCWSSTQQPVIARMGPNNPNLAQVQVLGLLNNVKNNLLGTLSIWYSQRCQTNWMAFVPSAALRQVCSTTAPISQNHLCSLVNDSEFDRLGADGKPTQHFSWFPLDPTTDVHTPMIYAPNPGDLVGGVFDLSYPPNPAQPEVVTKVKVSLFQTSM